MREPKFFARRLPRPSRRWVLENRRGHMMPSVGYHPTYSELLHAASIAGFSILDIELRYHRGSLLCEVEEAMWSGDTELLSEIAGCKCCCWEHTFESYPARLWHGCRGSGQMTHADVESWVRHYAEHHGMTREQFFGGQLQAASSWGMM